MHALESGLSLLSALLFGKGELRTLHPEWRHLLSHPGQSPGLKPCFQAGGFPDRNACVGL